MIQRDTANLIKNIYDQSTIDTLRQLDQNLAALMKHNAAFQHIEVLCYERVPLKPGSPQSRIRVDISRKGVKSFFFLSEDMVSRLEDSNDIRKDLQSIMNEIKAALP